MAAIVKWPPFRELDWMDRRMRRIFDDFVLTPGLFPAADVYETKDEFVVELEAPGFEQKELAIEVTDHTLVVRGERTEANKDEKDKQFRLRDRLDQAFERRFYLPSDSDTDQVKAKFRQGHSRSPHAEAPDLEATHNRDQDLSWRMRRGASARFHHQAEQSKMATRQDRIDRPDSDP